MADTKISALTAATTPLAGTEVLPIVQSGVTKQVSVANLTAGRAVSADSLTLTGSPLPATSGGTGQSSYAVGDLLYASTTTALSKLADVVTGNALISGGVGVAPSWGKIGLTTHVSGTLAVGNGGTGLSSVTQGDLLYGSAANTLSALAKNTTASRYLSNTGTSNNPAWAQVDLTNGVTGTLPVGNGGTGTATAFTAGSVVFAGASGVYSQNNANFFWDNTNNRLGLGLTNPSYPLEIGMTNSVSLVWQRTGVSAKKWGFQSDNDATYLTNVTDNTLVMSFFNAGGVSIGNTTNPGATNLSVSGSITTASAAKGIIGSSSFSVTIANGAAGNLVDLSTALPVGGSGLVIVNGASAGKATILAQRDSGGYYSVTELGTQPRGTYITSITLSGTNLRITNSTGASETFTGKVVVLSS